MNDIDGNKPSPKRRDAEDGRWPCTLGLKSMRIAVFLLLFWVSATTFASSFECIDPTPAELAMKSYAKAPGASAVILSYDEEDESLSAEALLHVRIKVLTEGGRSAGNIELPDGIAVNLFDTVYGRTIHPDGRIAVFAGKLTKKSNQETSHTVMALPDVEVGSIVEYGYHIVGSSFFSSYSYLNPQYAPWWQVQQAYHLCSGHFQLKTSGIDRASVRWVSNLPLDHRCNRLRTVSSST